MHQQSQQDESGQKEKSIRWLCQQNEVSGGRNTSRITWFELLFTGVNIVSTELPISLRWTPEDDSSLPKVLVVVVCRSCTNLPVKKGKAAHTGRRLAATPAAASPESSISPVLHWHQWGAAPPRNTGGLVIRLSAPTVRLPAHLLLLFMDHLHYLLQTTPRRVVGLLTWKGLHGLRKAQHFHWLQPVASGRKRGRLQQLLIPLLQLQLMVMQGWSKAGLTLCDPT